MANDGNTGNGGGVGFLGLLTIAFIVLRLCGVIDWPWALVLAPTLVPLALAIFIYGLIIVVMRHK